MKQFYPIMLYSMSPEKKNYFASICVRRLEDLFITWAENAQWAIDTVNILEKLMEESIKKDMDMELMKRYHEKLDLIIDENLYPDGYDEDDYSDYTLIVYERAAIMSCLPKLLLNEDKDEWLQNIISRCVDAMNKNEVNRVDMRADEESWQKEAFKKIYEYENFLPINEQNIMVSSMKEQINNIRELEKYLKRNFEGLGYKSLINCEIPIKVIDKINGSILEIVNGVNIVNKLHDVEVELSYTQSEKEKRKQTVRRNLSESFSTISCKYKFNEDTSQLIIDTVSNTVILGK